jgi:predicted ATP-binding protein involved in virulence
MKLYLSSATFYNRAPFEKLVLHFEENEIAVLTAVNGRGKTTILSHIVDAFHEMAKPFF